MTKKIINKYHHLRRKRKSTLDISELHVFPSSKQNKATSSNSRNKNAKIAAKNFLEKYKKISRKKTPFSFNISDIADVGTVDYNNDTNISDVLLNKSVQITAKKAVQKYKILAKNKAPLPFNITHLADDETVNYNNDTIINDILSNKSAQIAAKKIVTKYRNLERKKPYQRPSKKPDDDVVFLKQVPVHPRDRLARKTKGDVKFVKQVPFHPRERLKRKIKSTIEHCSGLTKKSKDDDVTFIKQVPLHPCKRKKRLENLIKKLLS